MKLSNTTRNPQNDRIGRKSYRPPQVEIYGDLRELTQAVNDKSKVDDNGTGMNDKTA